jgi:molybdopterin converting factor small subunit
MKVIVKFYIFDLPPGFEDAHLLLSGSATVSDLFDACLELFEQRGVTMDESELRTATVMVGDIWSDPGDAVSDGDTITIIRPMDGG